MSSECAICGRRARTSQVPLYTADALVLRTYKLGEADRIVVFLTRDRGKKRGVAQGARRPRSKFRGRARAAHRSARRVFREGAARAGQPELRRDRPVAARARATPEGLGYTHYFAELIDAWAADCGCRRAAVPAWVFGARRAGDGHARRRAGALFRVLAAAAAGRLSGRSRALDRRRSRSSTRRGRPRPPPRAVWARRRACCASSNGNIRRSSRRISRRS